VGCAEAVLAAHGFTVDQMVDVVAADRLPVEKFIGATSLSPGAW
jgi:hypothetical protein